MARVIEEDHGNLCGRCNRMDREQPHLQSYWAPVGCMLQEDCLLPQASILIVQCQVGQFRRFSTKLHMNNWFGDIFDHEIIWEFVTSYWLDETDRSVRSGVSDFGIDDITLRLDNIFWRWTIDIDAYSISMMTMMTTMTTMMMPFKEAGNACWNPPNSTGLEDALLC